MADRFQIFRQTLPLVPFWPQARAFSTWQRMGFWTVMAVSLFQAATLSPLVPLADALSLAHARPREKNMKGFEYGWVRGTGSAAFIAGTLLAGHVTGGWGFSAIIWLSAAALLTVPVAASMVPAFPARAGER